MTLWEVIDLGLLHRDDIGFEDLEMEETKSSKPVVESWEELLSMYNHKFTMMQKDHEGKISNWIFRGQTSSAWDLKTTLERACEGNGMPLDRAADMEKMLLREFQRKFHIYDDRNANQYVPGVNETDEWLALMQHHGAPTRLLDCTYSFFIAAFFALADASPSEECVVWAFDSYWLNHECVKKIFEKEGVEEIWENYGNSRDGQSWEQVYMRPEPIACVMAESPIRLNQRSAIQQGVFLCVGDITKSFLQNLAAMQRHDDDGDKIIEIKINRKKVRIAALEHLLRTNVTYASMFPGLDGFAKSLGTTSFPMLEHISDIKKMKGA
jgi:hypothetical protein